MLLNIDFNNVSVLFAFKIFFYFKIIFYLEHIGAHAQPKIKKVEVITYGSIISQLNSK